MSTFLNIFAVAIIVYFLWLHIPRKKNETPKPPTPKKAGEYITCFDGVTRPVISQPHHWLGFSSDGSTVYGGQLTCEDGISLNVPAYYRDAETSILYIVKECINNRLTPAMKCFLRLWCTKRHSFRAKFTNDDFSLTHKSSGVGFIRRRVDDPNKNTVDVIFEGTTPDSANALGLHSAYIQKVLVDTVCKYYHERRSKAIKHRHERKTARDTRSAIEKLFSETSDTQGVDHVQR